MQTQSQIPVAPSRAGRRRWLALAVVCLGAMMAFVNVSGTIGGLARIQADLHASPTATIWITSAYSLVVAALVLAAGTLGDLAGRRRVFLTGTLIFIAGSLLAFASGSAAALITAQAVMGVGGALVLPTSLAVVSHAFTDPHERTEAISVWAGSSGLGLALGPLGGGLLLNHFTWHSVFLINVVLGALAFTGTLLVVHESRRPSRSLDPVGIVLGTVAVAALTYAVIEGRSQGYTSARLLLVYAVFAVALALFITYEARHHDPMIDVRLFRSGSFSAVMGVAATAMFGFTGTALITVLYLQHVQHLTPLGAGLRLLAMFVPFIVISAVAARIVRPLGFKLTLTAGLILVGAGAGAVALTAAPSAIWPGLLVAGLGTGLLVAPSTAAAVNSVPPSQAGMASAVVNMFRQLGNVLGASILGTVLTTHFAADLTDRLTTRGLPADQIVTAAERGTSSGPIPPVVADQISFAFTDAYHVGALTAAAVLLAIAVPTALLVRRRPAA
ncbi:MFS transporter [Actinoplanes solisilvae]|uniref:MFS transporter n=1 Tax=Actinoplanes solisilvae TaxID=2486853 RepID=UPI000FD839C1|nr:MFS transporter [Actinoplanes solisilvae]